MKIRFSVVMPVYNREKYLRQAIDSILSQTFRDFELIVVDDGSTDRSVQLLKSYGSRIRLIQQQNRGPEVARNTAAAAARGEYLALLDSDDFFFPTALEIYDRVIRAFDSPPLIIGSHLSYSDGDPISVPPPAADPVEAYKLKDFLSKTAAAGYVGSAHLIRKSAYDEIGGFRNSDAQTWYGDTFDCLLKLGTLGPCILIRKPHTVVYRLHETNSIKSLKAHADGMLGIARSERAGVYPGGWKRRWDRYAYIGAVCLQWAMFYCWRGSERKTAIRLLLGTAPMALPAIVKRSLRIFRKPARVVIIPADASSGRLAPAATLQDVVAR
jgi:glycosyltransferase involved in cell wall biosynthesis